jgi:hypothetical protein
MKTLGICITFASVIAACSSTENIGQQNAPVISGDECAVHADQPSCVADEECQWFDLGRPCQEGMPCQSGVCVSKSGSGSGSGSGHGGGMAGCVCPNGGVCFEQIGGPAQHPGTGPEVQCTVPTPGSGDPCARITGQGTCTDDSSVSGLCLCDNGIR